MDSAVKLLQTISVDQIKKHQGPYKREFQKISHGFKSLSQAFGSDTQACEWSAAAGSWHRSFWALACVYLSLVVFSRQVLCKKGCSSGLHGP